MTSPVDIRSDHLRIVQDVLRAHLPGDAKAWVFGSRAAWTTKDSSDLDLAIEGEMAFDSRIIGALQDAFEDSDLPYTVDVVDINRISNGFRQIIEAQKIPLSIPKHFLGTRNRPNQKNEQSAHEQGDAKIGQASDIIAEHRKTVLTLLKRHLPNTTVWTYRSRAKQGAQLQSDLDLVVFASPKQSDQVSDLREAFKESDLPYRVELFVWDEVPESFREQIEAEHVALVERTGCSSLDLEWPIVVIEDISEKVAMGPFGSSIKVSTFVPDGVPIISGQHLRGVRVDDSPGFNFISYEHAQRLANANVKRGDIVFSHRGNIGQVAYIPESSMFEQYVVSQSQFYLRCDRFKAIPEYIVAFFKSPEGQHKLLANASQVGVPSIARPVTYLRTVEIPLPTLPEQHAIAHILGTLDDKIELNHRMNETLEAMARVLFKSWFIDFDPVRAKMEGRDTGLPDDIDKLFPDRMVDSELGEIPEGWKVGMLGNIARAPRRGVDPAGLHVEMPYIGLEHMPRRSIALLEWGSTGRVTSSKSVFEKGDILFGKLRPYFHKVGIAPVSGVCSTDIVVITPKVAEWSAFLLVCVSSVKFVTYTNQTSTGTKMPRTSWKTMSSYRLCLPAESVAQAFQKVAQPILERVLANIYEFRTLTALRDTLLPKLISGELRV